ncbi:Uu.00g136790.m01.CDS01 [Anthostomella pinea]|uniref:Uu.00g136790.m01.CDS01 n=1 Tax=Anthostomella pinea TaxID=933095 RepID=A0AAI8VQ60_9PEZI|nr:Uu.00g136790.m01.CDS01 [Anthostomella pinea]
MSRHPQDINRSTHLCLLPVRSDTGGLDAATKRSSACISAAEFKEIQEAWKARKKEEDQQQEAAEEAGWQRHAQAVASARTQVQNGGPDGGDAGQPLSSYPASRQVQGLPIGYQAATDLSNVGYRGAREVRCRRGH